MRSRISSTSILLNLLMVLSVIGAFGCGEDSSPTGVGGEGDPDPIEEIRTPKSFQINTIRVDSFDEKKGSVTWDASLSVAPRRPDVFVQLNVGTTSSAPIYVSTTKDDAFSGTFIDMNTAAVGTGLPRTIPVGSQLLVTLYDDDGILGKDFMGSVSFKPIGLYRDDNAAGWSASLNGSGGTKFRMTGEWVY